MVQKIPVDDPLQSLSGVELSPFNNMLYAAVTTSFNSDSVSGELLEFDPNTGALVATITLPDDPADNFSVLSLRVRGGCRRHLLGPAAQQR